MSLYGEDRAPKTVPWVKKTLVGSVVVPTGNTYMLHDPVVEGTLEIADNSELIAL